MIVSLTALRAALVRHHIATPAAPLPPARPGITWIWAANGIWKRGVDAHTDLLIRVGSAPSVPGLAALLPHVRWRDCPQRLPPGILQGIHTHARRCGQGASGGLLRPIEQQYHVMLHPQRPRLRVALPDQDASAARVSYAMPEGQVLLDLHSHHSMAAYFSATDDRDDTGLSVSAVIGRIFDRPEIAVRLNVYGHRQRIPATMIVESLGSFRDTYEGDDARTHD